MISVPPIPSRGGEILPWAEAITRAVRALLPAPGRHILPQSTPTGTSYLLRRAGGEPVERHPFEVYVSSVENGSTEISAINVTVNDMSWVMHSMKWDDVVGVTGLATEFAISTGDKVWLHLEIDGDREITAAAIVHGVPSDHDWSEFPDPVKFDDPVSPDRKQTAWNHLLAYVDTFPEDGEPVREGTVLPFAGGTAVLVQCTFNHLRACDLCDERNGVIVKTLVPWHAPYLLNT